jgi:hypothetical protein
MLVTYKCIKKLYQLFLGKNKSMVKYMVCLLALFSESEFCEFMWFCKWPIQLHSGAW